MADIRINALATTASSTASDDFVAIDGTTNGTRKLNAYSPTFGGNLTVSGTGTSSIAGNLTVGNDKSILVNKLSGAPSLSAASGGLQVTQYDLVTSLQFGGYNTAPYALWLQGTNNAGSSFPISINPLGGNLLVGTTTDSGNGKLQLATHTTSAGGIGFGTDSSLYRVGGGEVALDGISGNSPAFTLRLSGVSKSMLFNASGSTYLDTLTAGASIIFRSGNATTALTLDSSQRTILNGALRLNNAYTAGAPTATGYVTLEDSAGNSYKVLVGT